MARLSMETKGGMRAGSGRAIPRVAVLGPSTSLPGGRADVTSPQPARTGHGPDQWVRAQRPRPRPPIPAPGSRATRRGSPVRRMGRPTPQHRTRHHRRPIRRRPHSHRRTPRRLPHRSAAPPGVTPRTARPHAEHLAAAYLCRSPPAIADADARDFTAVSRDDRDGGDSRAGQEQWQIPHPRIRRSFTSRPRKGSENYTSRGEPGLLTWQPISMRRRGGDLLTCPRHRPACTDAHEKIGARP
jgi:hypothetical protein